MSELVPITTLCKLKVMSIESVQELRISVYDDVNAGNMFLRLHHIAMRLGNWSLAAMLMEQATQHCTLFRVIDAESPTVRILTLAPACLEIDTTQIDYLLQNASVRLDILYIRTVADLPSTFGDYDIVFNAICESDATIFLLTSLQEMIPTIPIPILNTPINVLKCARQTLATLLCDVPKLTVATTRRVFSEALSALPFPYTLRPIGFQRGYGLERIHCESELQRYCDKFESDEYYVSSFIEYKSNDGLYRKMRIAIIDYEPYICHYAISEHWVVHYFSAGMDTNAAKRAEEERVMQHFDADFAARHHDALSAIAKAVGLEYLVLDCAETQDGNLLLFEADARCWIHDTDSPVLYQYKHAIMQRAFDAFYNLTKISIPAEKYNAY
jgi:hypothetical protein